MSLIKNDIPILEYDTNSNAVIMPGHSTNFYFPERAVMLFMEKEIDDYVMTNECEVIKNAKHGRQTGFIVKQKKW